MATLLPAAFFSLFWCLLLLDVGVHAFSIDRPLSPENVFRIQCTSTLYATSSSSDNKKSFASISSDGVVSGAKRPTGSLGKPSRKKPKNQATTNQKPMSKKDRQRTANGTIQSDSNGRTGDPADQAIQVVRGSRGSKTVTIIRGMTATPAEEKKKILKLLKSKLGVGGTLVEGVLEVQGTHLEKVVEILKGLGYLKARKVGK